MRYILQVFPREDLAGCLLHGYKHRVIDYDGDVQDVSRDRFEIKKIDPVQNITAAFDF